MKIFPKRGRLWPLTQKVNTPVTPVTPDTKSLMSTVPTAPAAQVGYPMPRSSPPSQMTSYTALYNDIGPSLDYWSRRYLQGLCVVIDAGMLIYKLTLVAQNQCIKLQAAVVGRLVDLLRKHKHDV